MTTRYVPVEIDGRHLDVHVRFREAGGDLLFFVHGLACSGDSFREAWDAAELAQASLLAPDLPGFGNTQAPEGFSYTMADHARVCDALVAAHPAERLHIVAHSMGGAVALSLPAETLRRASSVVLVEGNLVAEDCVLSRRAVKVPLERFSKQYFPMMKLQSERDDGDFTDLSRTTPEAVYRSAESLVERSDSGDLLRALAALDCRRAYVHGANSGNPAACNPIDGVTVEPVEGCGHFPMNERPGTFYPRLAMLTGLAC